MKNNIVLLIALAFTVLFPVNKAIANTQSSATQLHFSCSTTVSHIQKKIILINKKKSSIYKLIANSNFEDESFDQGKCSIKQKEKITLLSSLSTYDLISFTEISKHYYTTHYGNPYTTIVQVPIYILNHALIIPFS